MNGCKNREPFKKSMIVQDGWNPDGTRKTIVVPFRMEQSCQYQKDDKYNDQQCNGCKHKNVLN